MEARPASRGNGSSWVNNDSVKVPRSRFGHNVRRPTQFVCPNSDSVCPNSDKIYLTTVTIRFLLLFFAY